MRSVVDSLTSDLEAAGHTADMIGGFEQCDLVAGFGRLEGSEKASWASAKNGYGRHVGVSPVLGMRNQTAMQLPMSNAVHTIVSAGLSS